MNGPARPSDGANRAIVVGLFRAEPQARQAVKALDRLA
jgi:hypothetical protein